MTIIIQYFMVIFTYKTLWFFVSEIIVILSSQINTSGQVGQQQYDQFHN